MNGILNSVLQENMDKFASEIGRLQKKRQSDMWKLLNAALASPQVSSQLTANSLNTNSILEENEDLSRHLQDLSSKLRHFHNL